MKDQEAINQMYDILSTFEDIEEGKVSGKGKTKSQDIQDTKALLEGYYSVLNDEVQPESQTVSYSTTPIYTGQDYSRPFQLTEEAYMNSKTVKTYSVKFKPTGQVLIDNIMMFESAKALENMLNEGKTLSDIKVLGIISSGLEYTKVVKECFSLAKQRQKVLKESRYDDAKVLDESISEYKGKAQTLKKRVLNFLRESGYIQ